MAEEIWQPQIPNPSDAEALEGRHSEVDQAQEGPPSHHMVHGPTPEALLPLDLPERVIVFRDRGHLYRHILRRITPELWKSYFSRLKLEVDGKVQRFDYLTPLLELYDQVVLRLEGYTMPRESGVEESAVIENWKELIPYGHRLKAASLLQPVVDADDLAAERIELGSELVALKATWTEASSRPGAMLEYRGLIHHFRVPSAAERQKFNNQSSKSIVVGGTRRGRTIYPSSGSLAAEFYDLLIRSVEGYASGGEALGSNLETIRREMDMSHKTRAINELFSVPDEETESELL